MLHQRIGRFFKNLLVGFGRDVVEDPEFLFFALPMLFSIVFLWLVGRELYRFIVDPQLHAMVAVDDPLSINPGKWLYR